MDNRNDDEDIQEAFNIFDKDKGGTIEGFFIYILFKDLIST